MSRNAPDCARPDRRKTPHWISGPRTILLTLLAVGSAACVTPETRAGLDPIVPGTLSVTISGLPAGVNAAVTVTGPSGFARVLTGTEPLTGLTPGSYTVQATPVTAGIDGYAPASATQTVVVASGPAVAVVTVQYALSTGQLSVTIDGLPPSGAAAVTVSGPGSFHRALTVGETLTGLEPGSYLVGAAPVLVGPDGYHPTPPTQTIVVAPASEPAVAAVTYGLATGSISVVVTGVPSGAAAAVSMTGPGGFQAILSTSQTMAGLVPGDYTVVAPAISQNGHTWAAAQPSVVIALVAGPTPLVATASYALVTGALGLTVSGLPAGVNGAMSLSGPAGFAAAITASTEWTGLVPGTYALSAIAISHAGHTYVPAPTTLQILVGASLTAASATVTYALATGGLTVTVTDLPSGAAGEITVTGPNGFVQSLTGTATLLGLAPGPYVISGATISSGGAPYSATPASTTVVVSASLTPATASITYALAVGSLTVTVAGVPGGATAAITVVGPGGFSRGLTGSAIIPGLVQGVYIVNSASISAGGHTYQPSPSTTTVPVTVGGSHTATVTYALATGALTVTVSGLPGGAVGSVMVTGPGFSQALAATATLTGLVPGSYSIAGSAIPHGGQTYTPAPLSQNKTIAASLIPVSATVVYAVSTGSLSVTVIGLPGGTNAAIAVTGPGGFSQALLGSQTMTGLQPGAYSVSASPVMNGGTTYAATPTSQTPAVASGGTTAVTVTYSAAPPTTLNLTVNGAYLVQATQTYSGSVRLVAGRDAYLRVFPLANQANAATPQVRVRLYQGAALVQTYTIVAPAATVPTAVNEGSLTASWNVLVPGALVQTGLSILADVDPAGLVVEGDETDNVFPTSGTPSPVTVVAMPTFNVTFVPVLQSVNGLQGNVTVGNTGSYLADVRDMLPIGTDAPSVRAVYTTNAPVLESSNANGAWGTILSEVLALKSADGSSDYYYGVVKTNYSSGVAGMGYVGGSARTSIGWDRLPSGSGVMAHELGHNMGRPHSPCGGASGADPSYPYPGAQIGVWGLKVGTLTLKAPTTNFDLMSYCNPDWISDYVWEKIVTYRLGGPNNAPTADLVAGQSRGLLVWGRMTPNGLVLEPSFVIDAPARVPVGGGPHRIEGLDRAGNILFQYGFTGQLVEDLPTGAEEHFAFVLPLSAALEQGLQGVRLRANGTSTLRVSSSATSGGTLTDLVTIEANAPGVVQLQWDAARHPMLLVREPGTGRILSFARGGRALIHTASPALDLSMSDGVTTRRGTALVP